MRWQIFSALGACFMKSTALLLPWLQKFLTQALCMIIDPYHDVILSTNAFQRLLWPELSDAF